MKIARVVLANQPRLRGERVLAAISNQPDIEILAQLEDVSEIQEAVASLRPDWVVVTLEESGVSRHSATNSWKRILRRKS